MSKQRATHQSSQASQTAAAGGRVFKSSVKRLPVVTKEMWAKIEAAARNPDTKPKRRYPEIVEAPDRSI